MAASTFTTDSEGSGQGGGGEQGEAMQTPSALTVNATNGDIHD